MKAVYKPVRGADLDHQLISVDGGRTYHRYQDLSPANQWLTKEYLPKEWNFAPSPRGVILRNAPKKPEREEIMSQRSNPPMGVAYARGTTAEFQQRTVNQIKSDDKTRGFINRRNDITVGYKKGK